TDLVNLNGHNLPAVGSVGSPANSGSNWLMIDSMADLNGSLYVANNGGMARSVGTPSPCAAPGCSNWQNATPTSAAWTGKTSVTMSNVAEIEPAQRAVPGLVNFGSRFFAARNTT